MPEPPQLNWISTLNALMSDVLVEFETLMGLEHDTSNWSIVAKVVIDWSQRIVLSRLGATYPSRAAFCDEKIAIIDTHLEYFNITADKFQKLHELYIQYKSKDLTTRRYSYV